MAQRHGTQKVSSEDWESKESPPEQEHQRMEDIHTLNTLPAAEAQQTTTSLETSKTSHNLTNTRARLGLHPIAPIVEEHDEAQHSDLLWPRIRLAMKEPFAEFFGVFILVLFGDGSVAQVLLSAGQTTAPGGDGFGQYQSINWGWGLGTMLGIYVAGDSGAYLNPAILFTNCIFRKLPWRRLPVYLVAQFLGGFLAAGVIYINYINGINKVEGHGIRTVPPSKTGNKLIPKSLYETRAKSFAHLFVATAGIFCTYPQDDMTKAGMFFDEFIASWILMFVIFALKDDTNKGSFSASGAWFPLALFFLIFGIGACFGWQTGYAINLARDFGPRLMSYAVGYGHEVWSAGGYYFWIPIVAPFLGCAFGGLCYDLFIYTGPSPINTPYLGLAKLFNISETYQNRLEQQRREGLV